jgi:hypothetical protein
MISSNRIEVIIKINNENLRARLAGHGNLGIKLLTGQKTKRSKKYANRQAVRGKY